MRESVYLLLLFMISCNPPTATDDTGGSGDEQDEKSSITAINFIPLEIGNYWVYQNESDRIDTVTISESINHNGEFGFVDDQSPFTTYVDSGLIRYDFLSTNGPTGRMLYKYPSVNDNFYEQAERNSFRFKWYTKIVSTDSVITNQAGTFNTTIFFSFREIRDYNWQSDVREEYYFAEEVGIVRIKTQWWYSSCFCWYPVRTTDLIDYHIGNEPYNHTQP